MQRGGSQQIQDGNRDWGVQETGGLTPPALPHHIMWESLEGMGGSELPFIPVLASFFGNTW